MKLRASDIRLTHFERWKAPTFGRTGGPYPAGFRDSGREI